MNEIPFVAVGNGELCPFCEKVTITADENGKNHLIKCIEDLNEKKIS